ncbi:5478_t:CDS:2 [Gigaspora rosea]|nr:5478_t:CDS:2 [Gigaspora rosea]
MSILGWFMETVDEHTVLVYGNKRYIDDEILSFNLLSTDIEENVGNTLRLATYLREIVCASGALIRLLLNRQPMIFNYNLRAALPKLPCEAVKPQESKTK